MDATRIIVCIRREGPTLSLVVEWRGYPGHDKIWDSIKAGSSPFQNRGSESSLLGLFVMNSVIDHWKTQLISLSPGDRVELAHFLLSSLEPEDEGVEAAWDAEATRRAEEIRSGRATGRPVDDFIAELRERYP
jgi:putative addiction module component (TIGR02574 family)